MYETEKSSCCCFLGHRNVKETEALWQILHRHIEHLITEKAVSTFLFGSKSQFDEICYRVVTSLKEKYPHIQRVYVRAEFPYIGEEYRAYLLQGYEDTYFPQSVHAAGRGVYIKRNFEMIDTCAFCVFYYDVQYALPKNSQQMPKSGTKIAYLYAERKGRSIFNAAEMLGHY